MVRRELRISAGAVVLGAAGVCWWLAGDTGVAAVPSASAEVSEPAVPLAAEAVSPSLLQAALRIAAAQVCADGCEEPEAAEPAAIAIVATEGPARLPIDLDAWSLAPEPLQVIDEQRAAERNAPRRLYNTPPAPDENDPTPADEHDPYEPLVEEPAEN